MRVMRFEKGKKIRLALVITVCVIIAILFPVRKDMTTDYYSKDGTKVGSVKEKVVKPWWMPESALSEEKPLEEADKETVRELIVAAEAKGDYKTAEKIKKDAGLVAGTTGGTTGDNKPGSANNETTEPPPDIPGSTSGSGGTIESKIPAAVSGYRLHTEQRSTLSWLGVFKPETDTNIQNLDIFIGLIGKDKATKDVEDFKKTYGTKVGEVRVEGLKAYRGAVSTREVKLVFVDGDFYYELDLLVKENSDRYLDAIVKTAEDARI